MVQEDLPPTVHPGQAGRGVPGGQDPRRFPHLEPRLLRLLLHRPDRGASRGAAPRRGPGHDRVDGEEGGGEKALHLHQPVERADAEGAEDDEVRAGGVDQQRGPR